MNQKVSEDLAHIRSMMERSSRFISLSGLSGVGAGVTGLLSGLSAMWLINGRSLDLSNVDTRNLDYELTQSLVILGCITLIVALLFGCYFTVQKSKKLGLKIWTQTTYKILQQLAIPLVVGGIFVLALLEHSLHGLVAGTTLIFYGLALISVEKYTYSDIKYLGVFEVVLGCISLFWIGKGLLFWTFGFGILHIIYGIILYKKYK